MKSSSPDADMIQQALCDYLAKMHAIEVDLDNSIDSQDKLSKPLCHLLIFQFFPLSLFHVHLLPIDAIQGRTILTVPRSNTQGMSLASSPMRILFMLVAY